MMKPPRKGGNLAFGVRAAGTRVVALGLCPSGIAGVGVARVGGGGIWRWVVLRVRGCVQVAEVLVELLLSVGPGLADLVEVVVKPLWRFRVVLKRRAGSGG